MCTHNAYASLVRGGGGGTAAAHNEVVVSYTLMLKLRWSRELRAEADMDSIKAIFQQYELRDNILSRVSRQDALSASVAFGYKLTVCDKRRYLRNTYLEDGIEAVTSHDENSRRVVHTLDHLCMFVTNWLERYLDSGDGYLEITWINPATPSFQGRSMRLDIVTWKNEVSVGAYNEDFTEYCNKVTMYRMLYCTKHSIQSQKCINYGLSQLKQLLSIFEHYSTTSVAAHFVSQYSCRPSFPIQYAEYNPNSLVGYFANVAFFVDTED